MVRQTPFGHDRAAARDDAGQTLRGHRDVAQQYAGVNGEVVDSLFGLFQQGIAEDFPGEVLGDAVDLLQCLVNRHSADGDRTVTQDPLAGFVDIAAGREIHHRIGAPAGRPDQFLDLFFDGGGHRRVADISIHFYQEVAPDNHRLRLRVVDIGRDDGAPGGHFIADKLGGNVFRQAGAEAFSGMLLAQNFAANTFTAHVFAYGDELHLRGDDPLAGVVQLGNTFAGNGAFWR